MPSSALFGLSVAFGVLTWSIVAGQYLWPALSSQPRVEALRPLLLLHSFRFIGLAFLVPGVVSPELAVAFARPAAYGDLIAAVLALLALAALRRRWGVVLVWAFNVWGSADLLYAFYQGNRVGFLPGQLGAAYFIPTFIVPLLLVTHGLMFRLLLQGGGPADARAGRRLTAFEAGAPGASVVVSGESNARFHRDHRDDGTDDTRSHRDHHASRRFTERKTDPCHTRRPVDRPRRGGGRLPAGWR